MATSADARLRVCIIAKATPFIWVHHYVKAFRAVCDTITVGSALSQGDLATTGRTHLAHLVVANDIDRDIEDIAELVALLPEGWRPDLVVSIQSGVPQVENISWLGCPTAYVSVDTWHDFAETILARPYDFVFAAQREFAAHFTATGSAHAHWLPLACDPDVHRPMDCRKDYDIAFVGSTERSLHTPRILRLEQLAQRYSVLAGTALDGVQMSRAYARGRMAFNSSVAQDVNMRVFEAMAMGVALLTNRDADVNGLLELFTDGEHLIAYDDTDLLERAGRYLGDDALRARVADSGRESVLARHTYAHRVNTMLAIISAEVDWNAVRARPLLRDHGALLDYVPTVPGRVADLGMNAGVSKYALRRAGASHVTGVALGEVETERRSGSFDAVIARGGLAHEENRFDTVLAVSTPDAPISRGAFGEAHTLLRAGGSLVAGLSRRDIAELDPAAAAGTVWAEIERLGYVVLRMELREPDGADDVSTFVVARKLERSLKEVAREVYSRNPIPGLSLEETVARVP